MRQNINRLTHVRSSVQGFMMRPHFPKGIRFCSPESFFTRIVISFIGKIPDEVLYIIRSTRIFGFLEKPLFMDLYQHIETRHLKQNEMLFNICDDDDSIYTVCSGCISVFTRVRVFSAEYTFTTYTTITTATDARRKFAPATTANNKSTLFRIHF